MTVLQDRSSQATAVAQESILDKVDRFTQPFLDCEDEQRWAGILYAAATGIIREVPAFPRLAIVGDNQESGKTLFMKMMAYLSTRPMNASGTEFGLVSALVEADSQIEMPVPTLYLDEAGTKSLKRGILSDLLREGYQTGETRSRSVSGQAQYYSIYVPFMLTCLRSGIPKDIRSRCIVITMKPGHPKQYFDVRDAQKDAKSWGRELSRQARGAAQQVNEFRVRSLGIPELQGRKAEIWEPLFAIAQALGGQKWLNRCLAAFRLLALAQSDRPELNPEQKLLQAVVEIAPSITLDGFVPGSALADELRRMPEYRGRSLASAAMLISHAMPVCTIQRRMPSGDQLRGYRLLDILEAWEQLRPQSPEEMEEQHEVNPFDIPEDELDDEAAEELTGDATAATAATASFTTVAAVVPAASSEPALQPVKGGDERVNRVSAPPGPVWKASDAGADV